MVKGDDALRKLLLMLYANPELLASEPLKEVREDLRDMGVDPDALCQSVRATLTRWLEAAGAGTKLRPVGEHKRGLEQAPPTEITRRALVNPWMPTAVHMAFPVPSRARVRQFIAQVGELAWLGVEPHLRIDVRPKWYGCELLLAIEPKTHPKRPGRLVERKPGEIEVCLVRAGEKRHVAVIGSRFTQTLRLSDYVPDEEAEWEVEVTIRLGAPPGRS